MPFAKQEMRGSGEPVYAELSIAGYNNGMEFDILGVPYSSLTVVDGFLKLIDSIKPQDIIGEMPVRREPPGNP